jgi:ATP-dependent DNA helicase RecQ
MISLKRIEIALSSILSDASTSEGPLLYVLAGMPCSSIEINVEYLFSVHCTALEEYFDKAERRRMINDAVTRGNRGGAYWCLLEDYLLLNASVIEDFFAMRFIKLPYFKNILPFSLSFEGEARTSSFEEDECATECTTPVFLGDDVCRELEGRIGQLYRIGGELFFTTPMTIAWEALSCETKAETETDTEPDYAYTVTDDEASWIMLCRAMRNVVPDGARVGVFISSEGLKSAYSDAVGFLGRFSANDVFLKMEEAKSERKHTYDTLAVLKKYWGVTDFREFCVYRNVRSSGNVKIETVRQSDVIDDILTQVDLAQAGNSYRDVFVTAPTGSGKSLMFQIPSILLHERALLTLVVSPLIALMNDQVYSLTDKGLNIAATINSSVSLSGKETIIEKVKAGDVSVLYLSPESLLSRSDITALIGGRTIGLLVVDEAHIVTTWGKAFRPDYWYLGNYIQRLRKEGRFPIATFTATAIYKGPEDMYSETRDSLGMRDPITYFGYIPRKNIRISFEKSEGYIETKTREYNEVKFSVLASRLEELKKEQKKVLVYFPFVSLINDFIVFIVGHETAIKPEDVVQYHGGLSPIGKKESFQRYRSNGTQIMLATKAFGMGIDIPDIDVVYHFAPTGNVCDYIQEIGRAARDERISGLAKFDYLMKDFSFVNRLYGISAIRPSQLLGVMKKILEIGASQGYKRNLLISSDDFQLIFDEGGRYGERDAENLDNKVKTALLIIEKDFLLKLGYSPIVARPRALFTYSYFKGNGEQGEEDLRRVFGNYREDIGECTRVDLKGFWETRYPNYSFAKLKYELYSDPAKFGFSAKDSIVPIVVISVILSDESASRLQSELIDSILAFCDGYRQSNKYFKQQQLEEFLKTRNLSLDEMQVAMLAETMLRFLDAWNRSISLNHGRFITFREDLGYRIIGSGYIDIRDFFSALDIRSSRRLYVNSAPKNQFYLSKVFAMLGLFDAAGVLSYTVQGGENPEIYIRINSYYHLQNMTRDHSRYENIILRNVKARHENSVKFLEYLFSSFSDQTELFWAFIESYFLGAQPDTDKGIDQELIRIERSVMPISLTIPRAS